MVVLGSPGRDGCVVLVVVGAILSLVGCAVSGCAVSCLRRAMVAREVYERRMGSLGRVDARARRIVVVVQVDEVTVALWCAVKGRY